MRIILADHNPHVRWALKVLLNEELDFVHVDEVEDAQGLLMLVENQSADLILIDSALPGCSIAELMTDLNALEPKPTIMVMSSEVESSRWILNDGADSFISKMDDPAKLVEKLVICARSNKEVDQ